MPPKLYQCIAKRKVLTHRIGGIELNEESQMRLQNNHTLKVSFILEKRIQNKQYHNREALFYTY